MKSLVIQITSVMCLMSINCITATGNIAPYFVPGSGDFTGFSIPENFQVGTSVYKLKGELTTVIDASSGCDLSATKPLQKVAHKLFFFLLYAY